MVAGVELTPELAGRVERRVNHAPELRLRCLKGVDQIGERRVTDDHQVDVAGVALLAAGEGAEDEGEAKAVAEGLKGAAEEVDEADGFDDEGAQLGEDGAAGVEAEKDLPAARLAGEEPGGGKGVDLALHRADGEAAEAGEFAKVVRLVGPGEQQAEHGAARLAEEEFGEGVGRRCTHSGYNCILFGYTSQVGVAGGRASPRTGTRSTPAAPGRVVPTA